MKQNRKIMGVAIITLQIFIWATTAVAQTTIVLPRPTQTREPTLLQPTKDYSLVTRFLDPATGMTADEAVTYALLHNGELLAGLKDVETAQAVIRQAGFKANPKLDVTGAQNVIGPDNNLAVTGSLPLELGGRRSARIAVAERELEMRREALANFERLLAAEVRQKFGFVIAEAQKLGFIEELLALNQKNSQLVAARVADGRSALLEENLIKVEVNRVKSELEVRQGKVEVLLLELRNLLGMEPEEPLRLRGNLRDSLPPVVEIANATQRALNERPDLKVARAAEHLAEAHEAQARSEGRFDASLILQYQYMNFGYPLKGFSDAGRLEPIQGRFHYFGAGVSLELPWRNKNQGAIQAAISEKEAATRRREFAELTARREITAGYARYRSAMRAEEIFRTDVRGQAERNLSILQKAYELGSKTLLDYIAEQRRFIEFETGFIDALLEIYQSRIDIQWSTSSPELMKK